MQFVDSSDVGLVPLPAHCRTALLVDLVVRLVAHVGRVALLVDDAPWIDHNSWSLMRAIVSANVSAHKFLAVLCHRPVFDKRTSRSSEVDKFIEAAGFISEGFVFTETLAPLTEGDAMRLASFHGETKLDETHIKYVVKRSE